MINYFPIKTSLILFYLIPFALISGPFIPDLFLSIISLIFIIDCISKKNFNYFRGKFFKIFIIFWIFLNITSIFSLNILDSLKTSFFFLRFGIFSIASIWIIENNKDVEKNFLKIIITSFLFLFVDSGLQFYTGKNILGYELYDQYRASSLFRDELIMGSHIVRLLPFAVFLFCLNNIKKTYIFFFILLSNFAIIFSGERTSFLLAIIFDVLILLKLFKFKKSVSIIIITSFFFFIFSFILLNKKMTDRLIFYPLMQVMKKSPSYENLNLKQIDFSEAKYIFSSEHEAHFIIAYNIFLQNPYFGGGLKSFRNLCNKEKYNPFEDKRGCATHPHNIYMQLLSETGIFFCLAIFCLWLFLVLELFKMYFNKSIESLYIYILLIGFFLNLFPFLPSGNIFTNRLDVTIFLPLGFLLFRYNKKIL